MLRYRDCLFFLNFSYLAWSSWHYNALLRSLYKNIVWSCVQYVEPRQRERERETEKEREREKDGKGGGRAERREVFEKYKEREMEIWRRIFRTFRYLWTEERIEGSRRRRWKKGGEWVHWWQLCRFFFFIFWSRFAFRNSRETTLSKWNNDGQDKPGPNVYRGNERSTILEGRQVSLFGDYADSSSGSSPPKKPDAQRTSSSGLLSKISMNCLRFTVSVVSCIFFFLFVFCFVHAKVADSGSSLGRRRSRCRKERILYVGRVDVERNALCCSRN